MSADGRRVQHEIGVVLYRVWDPLELQDIAPANEYEAYVGRVYRRLTVSRSRDEIAAELGAIETEFMGNNKSSLSHRLAVADRLLAIDIALRA